MGGASCGSVAAAPGRSVARRAPATVPAPAGGLFDLMPSTRPSFAAPASSPCSAQPSVTVAEPVTYDLRAPPSVDLDAGSFLAYSDGAIVETQRLSFQPGMLGITYDEDTGEITEVDAG